MLRSRQLCSINIGSVRGGLTNRTTATCIAGIRSKTSEQRPKSISIAAPDRVEAEPFTRTRRCFEFVLAIFAKRLWRGARRNSPPREASLFTGFCPADTLISCDIIDMEIKLTAVFRNFPMATPRLSKSCPGKPQGATLEEAPAKIEAVEMVLQANRELAEESLRGPDVLREPLAAG